ncbi:extracellular catalytic domain type 1 short-chain-length polyhydroxyalkanoate depolymerase [Sorangium sp. So ce128]|uniref:extracellular catalytic domain type 1 short-chain-length polyhydroxyalkanoate depolymerase n=1 Tax=Sorangium sp. So ce128 TaxID=3133281 RepID=UPI003F631010
MTTTLRFVAPAAASLATVLLAISPSLAASWQTRVNYGGNTPMDLYVPDKVDASPGVVVSLHYCSGNAGNAHGWFQSLADQHGFLIITPQAGGNCFDATPARSGEREAITKMVQYAITQHHADPTRVFAAGASSGACMTNALLAAYPDVFAGGSVLAGVPAGAWTGGNAYGWTTPANRTAAQWGDIVRKASPNFTGARPRLQLWHGTGDTTLNYDPNFPAEIAQWTNVLGLNQSDGKTSSFRGSSDTWNRSSYTNAAGKLVLETNSAQGAPHDLSGRGLWGDAVRFFGLDMDPPSTGEGAGGGDGTGGSDASGGGGAANGSASGAGGSATSGAGGEGGSVTSGAGGEGGSATSGAGNGATTGGAAEGAGGATTGGSTGNGGGSTSSGDSDPATTGGDGTSDDAGGCSFNVASRGQLPRGALVGLLVAGLGAVVRRRRRSAA